MVIHFPPVLVFLLPFRPFFSHYHKVCVEIALVIHATFRAFFISSNHLKTLFYNTQAKISRNVTVLIFCFPENRGNFIILLGVCVYQYISPIIFLLYVIYWRWSWYILTFHRFYWYFRAWLLDTREITHFFSGLWGIEHICTILCVSLGVRNTATYCYQLCLYDDMC